jgi:hypothetical protein
MKLSLLLGAAIGYVLGARAGRERYEQIVRMARNLAGSQTVQSTAGVLQAQVEDLRHRAKDVVNSKLHAGSHSSPASGTSTGSNGYRG